jgi:L-fuconolactonase
VRQLGPAGLSFDLCCFHHQLPAVIRLVRACPDTAFILDHFGKPGIKAGLLDPWRAHIDALAALPNVDCKLSGLITEANHAAWTQDHLRPYVDHVLAAFGPSRLLFGGDWPVAKLAGPYTRWLDTARQLVSHVSPEGQAAIFADTARRVYRLP